MSTSTESGLKYLAVITQEKDINTVRNIYRKNNTVRSTSDPVYVEVTFEDHAPINGICQEIIGNQKQIDSITETVKQSLPYKRRRSQTIIVASLEALETHTLIDPVHKN